MKTLGPYGSSLVAHVAFWVILAVGLALGELWPRRAGLFALAWFAGAFAIPYFVPPAGLLVTTYVAILDIILVLVVFRGDVRLS